MTIESNYSVDIYNGNGNVTEFPFYFNVFEKGNLLVTITNTNVSPNVTTYPEIDEETITLTDTGGTLIYYHTDDSGASVALPSGYKLALSRNMPFLQELSIQNGQRFNAEEIENSLDILMAGEQQLSDNL